MNGKFVLDTNVIIDYLNGQEELKPLSEQIASGIGFVSVITRMELFAFPGLTPEGESGLKCFLADLIVVPLNDEIEQASIAIRRNTRLKLPDAIVAATACIKEAALITRDKHLLDISWPGINILVPK
jgi:predicted nucleic acid-binding protein